jgi:hypothetical protein
MDSLEKAQPHTEGYDESAPESDRAENNLHALKQQIALDMETAQRALEASNGVELFPIDQGTTAILSNPREISPGVTKNDAVIIDLAPELVEYEPGPPKEGNTAVKIAVGVLAGLTAVGAVTATASAATGDEPTLQIHDYSPVPDLTPLTPLSNGNAIEVEPGQWAFTYIENDETGDPRAHLSWGDTEQDARNNADPLQVQPMSILFPELEFSVASLALFKSGDKLKAIYTLDGPGSEGGTIADVTINGGSGLEFSNPKNIAPGVAGYNITVGTDDIGPYLDIQDPLYDEIMRVYITETIISHDDPGNQTSTAEGGVLIHTGLDGSNLQCGTPSQPHTDTNQVLGSKYWPFKGSCFIYKGDTLTKVIQSALADAEQNTSGVQLDFKSPSFSQPGSKMVILERDGLYTAIVTVCGNGILEDEEAASGSCPADEEPQNPDIGPEPGPEEPAEGADPNSQPDQEPDYEPDTAPEQTAEQIPEQSPDQAPDPYAPDTTDSSDTSDTSDSAGTPEVIPDTSQPDTTQPDTAQTDTDEPPKIPATCDQPGTYYKNNNATFFTTSEGCRIRVCPKEMGNLDGYTVKLTEGTTEICKLEVNMDGIPNVSKDDTATITVTQNSSGERVMECSFFPGQAEINGQATRSCSLPGQNWGDLQEDGHGIEMRYAQDTDPQGNFIDETGVALASTGSHLGGASYPNQELPIDPDDLEGPTQTFKIVGVVDYETGGEDVILQFGNNIVTIPKLELDALGNPVIHKFALYLDGTLIDPDDFDFPTVPELGPEEQGTDTAAGDHAETATEGPTKPPKNPPGCSSCGIDMTHTKTGNLIKALFLAGLIGLVGTRRRKKTS